MHRKLLAAVAALALTAGHALAQQARSPDAVALLTGDAGQTYATLGALSVETHQTSLFPRTSPQQQLEAELRYQAAAMGADAVIHVKYEFSNAMTSKKGNKALGVAVRFVAPAATTTASAPAPSASPPPQASASAAAPTQPKTAPAFVTPSPATPVIAQPTPAPALAVSEASISTPAPILVAPIATPVLTSQAAAPVVHAATPQTVMLSKSAIPGRSYTKLRTISVTTHQTSMFPKTPPMTDLQNALKAEALKAGADAVVEVKYTMSNPMMSKRGNTASGVAVRFD